MTTTTTTTIWQRQWDISERGRFLYDLKPNVNFTSNFDFPTRQIYSQIAQLRTGFSKLNDYLYKIGVSESWQCKCGRSETIEHYLLHCELYYNEREAMRTTLFKQVGIAELTNDFKKEYGMTITLALGDFTPRHRDFKFHARPPHNSINYRETITAEITVRYHYRRDPTVVSTKNPRIFLLHRLVSSLHLE